MEVQFLHLDAGRVFGRGDCGLGDHRVAAMNLSPTGRAWTAHSEGCILTAYEDPKGSGEYSIGRGHHGVVAGMVWTQEHADAQFDADLTHVCSILNNRSVVKVDLTQGQFDALADWLYNIKRSEFYSSTLLKLLNMGDLAAACRELYWEDEDGNPHGWIYAAGEISPGLIARRKGEQILWNGGNPLEPTEAV